MEMPASMPMPAQLDTLEDFSLQRRAQAPNGFDATLGRRPLQLFDRGNSELPVDLRDLVRAQAGYRQHFEHALRDFLSHGVERGVRSGRFRSTPPNCGGNA